MLATCHSCWTSDFSRAEKVQAVQNLPRPLALEEKVKERELFASRIVSQIKIIKEILFFFF